MTFLRIMTYWELFNKAKDIITNRIGLKSYHKAIAKEAEETPIAFFPQMVLEASPLFVDFDYTNLHRLGFGSPTFTPIFFNKKQNQSTCPIKGHTFEKYVGDWAYVLDHNHVFFLVEVPWIMICSKKADIDEVKGLISLYYKRLCKTIDRTSITLPDTGWLFHEDIYKPESINKEFKCVNSVWVQGFGSYRPHWFYDGKILVSAKGMFCRFKNEYIDLCSIYLRRVYKTREIFGYGLVEYGSGVVIVSTVKRDNSLQIFVLKEDLEK